MADLIKCKAKAEFTVFVEGHGMVVGAPESSLPEAKNPLVPAGAVQRLIDEEKIFAPKGWAASVEKAAAEQAEAEAEAAEIAAAAANKAEEENAAAAAKGGESSEDTPPA